MRAASPIQTGPSLKTPYPEVLPRIPVAEGGLRRALRFGVAGGFITALDLALVWLLSRFLAPTLAVAIAYLVAMSIHFCLNKFWVFENRDLQYVQQMWKYGVTVLACWSCTVLVFAVAMHTLTTHILLAKILAIPPTTLLGYVMMRKFVFALPVREKAEP